MKSILVPLYWAWCGLSVFVLVRRRLKKGSGASGTADPVATVESGDPASPAPAMTPTPAPEQLVSVAAAPDAAPPDPAGAASLGIPLSRIETLAEALEGVQVPDGLAPLTGAGEYDPRALVLFTRATPPHTVGTAMADELERLGFALTPLDEQRLLALTDDATVEAAVYPDPTVVDESGVRRFPTAPADSVVLELRLR